MNDTWTSRRWRDCEFRCRTEGRQDVGTVAGQDRTGTGQDSREQDVQNGICQDMVEEDRIWTRQSSSTQKRTRWDRTEMHVHALLFCVIL